MRHLHERVTALVDGELSPSEERCALSHVAACADCRAAVETERRVKRALAAAAGPAVPDELVGRLMAMGGPAGPLRPREGHLPGTPRVPALPGPASAAADDWLLAAPAARASRARSLRPAGRAGSRRPASPAPTARPAPRRRVARRAGRRLTAVVLGTVSLAAVGMLSAGVLGGSLQLPGSAGPVASRLVIERGGVAGQPSSLTPVARFTPQVQQSAAPTP